MPFVYHSLILASYLLASREGAITCMQDPTDKESANAFFLAGDGEQGDLLIDAGWNEAAVPPEDLATRLAASTKVVTHLHYDHVRRLGPMHHTKLSLRQASYCGGRPCDLSRWQTVHEVEPFPYDGTYAPNDRLPAGVEAQACSGHSSGDSCFLHEASRTLFLGDLFYLGPLFTFLPGGSLSGNMHALQLALQDQRWDRVAQTHGDCYATRGDVERAARSLRDVNDGKVEGEWNFSFGLPLRAYPLETGAVLTLPLARQLGL